MREPKTKKTLEQIIKELEAELDKEEEADEGNYDS